MSQGGPSPRPGPAVSARRGCAIAPTRAAPTRAALALAAFALAVLPAHAQQRIEVIEPTHSETGNRPLSSGRLARLFDFEEMNDNPAPVPRYWFRAQDDPGVGRARPGFPRWNAAELDYTSPAARGQGSVKLPTRGGSVSLRLDRGVIPVFSSADYLISAKVRTQGLRHAKALLSARLLTSAGEIIEGSERVSEYISGDTWRTVSFEVPGESDRAAFLQLELQVLQPADRAGATRGRFAVYPQDTQGAAWFDDVAVVQQPRIELLTNAPTNIIDPKTAPALYLTVRDLTGEELAARLRVLDDSGNVIDSIEIPVGSGRNKAEWKPKLRRRGWYRATLELLHEHVRVGATYTDFIWPADNAPRRASAAQADPSDPAATPAASTLPAARLSPDRRRFGLVFDQMPPVLRDHLPDIALAAGVGRVTLPIWKEGLTKEAAAAGVQEIRPTVTKLLNNWCDLTFTLTSVPRSLAEESRLDPLDVWSLLVKDAALWQPYLDPYLDTFGQSVTQWQIGSAHSDRAVWRGSLDKEISAVDRALVKLVPGPRVVIPTPIEHPPSSAILAASKADTAIAALVPDDATPASLSFAASAWRASRVQGTRAPDFTAVFAPAPMGHFGVTESAEEMVRRVVEYWFAATAPGESDAVCSLALADAVRVVGRRRPTLMPTPELAVWRTLTNLLSDRRPVGTLPAAPGLRAMLFAPSPNAPASRGGLLALWNESAMPESAVLTSTLLGENALGASLVVTDPWGNTRTIPDPATTPLTVTAAPMLIEGIDVELVRFLAAVQIDPPFLSADEEEERNAIALTNPWPGPISGTIGIIEPGGFDARSGTPDRSWKISPRVIPFDLAAGQSTKLPISVGFSPAEESGEKTFVLDIRLQATRDYGVVRVQRPVELGLKDLALDLSAMLARSDTGPDVLVEAQITNLSSKVLDLQLTAFPPGMPRLQIAVGEVAPGNSAVRRIPLRNAAGSLRGKRIFVTVIDPEAGVRLNSSVVVP